MLQEVLMGHHLLVDGVQMSFEECAQSDAVAVHVKLTHIYNKVQFVNVFVYHCCTLYSVVNI